MNKEVIYVRIDEDLKKELDMIALEEQRSLNNLVVYILSKYLKEYTKPAKYINKNNDSVKYLKENSLMPYLIQEILSYILELGKKRTEFEDLYICIKEISTFYIENIYYLSNYFKTINIITPNIKNFKKISNN